MGTDGFSLADIKAVTEGNENGMFGGNGILALIIVFILLFNGGFGGFGFGGNRGDGGVVTQGELQRSFDTSNIMNKLNDTTNGICDGFYAMNTNLLNGFNGVNMAISNLGYKGQECCCNVLRAIDHNTCTITNNATANTQAILDRLSAMENAQKDLRIADLQCKINQNETVNAILNSQGRYVTNPPCPQYYGCCNGGF